MTHSGYSDLTAKHYVSDPFYPKSTAKLKPGDYCLLKREDGLSVPLVFIRKVEGKRKVFYGAIVDTVVDSKLKLSEQSNLPISDYAMIDVDCFKKNEAPILGNIQVNLNEREFREIYEDAGANYLGHKSRVWGYRTPLKYAEKVGA